MDFLQTFLNYLPSEVPGDFSFFLIFLGIGVGLGLLVGRTQLIVVAINAYIAFALLHVLPKTVTSFAEPYSETIVFLLLLVFLTIVGDYLFDIHISNASADFFWRILVMGLLTAGLIVSILFSLLPYPLLLDFISPATAGYFIDPWLRIGWMAAPLIFLVFINKRVR